jgi:hypothetical protein
MATPPQKPIPDVVKAAMLEAAATIAAAARSSEQVGDGGTNFKLSLETVINQYRQQLG